jgi:ABC-type protease/lipase transport system fused ATPase/permease subunit
MVRIRLPENSELATVLRSLRSPLLVVGGLSGFINILALSSSLFLMMVYDRVLPSGSGATLFGLFVIFGLAFVFHGILDATRSQMLVDIGRAFGDRLSRRVQQLQWRFALAPIPGRPRPAQDLDHIRGFMSGAGPAAFIDLPWVIFFLGVLFLMHPWLGVTTLAGIIVLALLTWHTERSIAKNMTALEPLRIERARHVGEIRMGVDLMVAVKLHRKQKEAPLDHLCGCGTARLDLLPSAGAAANPCQSFAPRRIAAMRTVMGIERYRQRLA